MDNDIISRWFHLGFNRKQWEMYRSMNGHQEELARNNVALVRPVSFFSAFLAVVFSTTRATVFHHSLISLIPFLVAAVAFFIVGLMTSHPSVAKKPIKASWILTIGFCFIWYTLAIYYDTFIQSQIASVLTCLAFACLPIMFDAAPQNNVIAGCIAYAAFFILQVFFAPTYLMLINVVDSAIALLIGLFLGQKKTSADAARHMYVSMYHTAASASTLVVQIDLLSDKFEALQIPAYISNEAPTSIPATHAIKIMTRDFMAPDSQEPYATMMDFDNLAHAFDDPSVKELTLVFQSYRNRWFQMIVREQARYKNQTASVVVVVQNINFVKQQELAYQRQLQETALEAQRANDSKTNFLRRMSHDVRTPINGIRGVLDMMETCPDDKERQAELRHKAHEASDYLLALVNSILDLGKLESGKITLQNEPFDLIELLKECDFLAESQARDKGITYSVDIDKLHIEHKNVIGSPLHLRQVLLNLATNAIKYNKPNGSVSIWTKEIAFDGKVATYEFWCQDTGIGMSKEFQKSAFEPFVQAKNDAQTTMGGSGLGLSIVKDMVESMGGTITLESEPDVGSTFIVAVPFEVNTIESADAQKADEPTKLDLSGQTALLVDDNDLNREIADFTLAKLGLTTVHATNGQEAVDAFAASEIGQFDMIFMDMMMPVMGGCDATRAIRALDRPDAQSVLIIAMTANAFADDKKACEEAGMNAHVGKPIDLDVLAATIAKLEK